MSGDPPSARLLSRPGQRPPPRSRVSISLKSSLRLRPLCAADLSFADSLRAHAGWNQTLADWRRFLALSPAGCFLAEWKGARAATATTLIYGPSVAWIGMVLVHPDYRRRGIGGALLEHCIEYLLRRGVRCIKLDATPLGKKVYDTLGFKAEWTLTRWTQAGICGRPARKPSALRRWREADAQAIERLDSRGFGIPRRRLLPMLARQSRASLVVESAAGSVRAFGLLRKGSQSLYLGPIIAASPTAARPVTKALLDHSRGESLYWDIPDPNVPAVEWARQYGFVAQRPLTRMYLGENTTPGDPRHQFGLGGPEIG